MNSLYARMETWRPYILSILRIVVGLLLLQHGLSKVFNYPAPSPVGALSGLLITTGDSLRRSAPPCSSWAPSQGSWRSSSRVKSPITYFMGHAPRSFYPIVNAGEVAVLFCFIFLYFAFAGGGPLSVDRAMLNQA